MTAPVPQPGKRSPQLDVKTVGGGNFDLHARKDGDAVLIVFYRGLHCPKCKTQLREFDARIDEFRKRRIQVVAVSMDDEQRASKARDEWEISANIPIGYALTEETAREWGLYLSDAEFDYEPARFAEPGLFLVNAESELYAGWIQTTPFARPQCDDLLAAIDFVREKSYPARGKAA